VARRFSSFGCRFEVRSSSDDLMDAIARRLPPLTASSETGSARKQFMVRAPGPCACGDRHAEYEVWSGRTLVGTSSSQLEAVDLHRATVKLWVAELAPRRTFIHAGAVAWHGQVIVLPGRTTTGKTTLVKALLDAGAVYLSDDMAVLDDDARVWPYPQPLGVRDLDADPQDGSAPQEDLAVEALGARTADRPLPVGAIVITFYWPDARWKPEPLTVGGAAMGLIEHAVAVRRRPEESLRRATALARAARVRVRSARPDATTVIEDLRHRLA
jgi:hypothetical protein